MGSVDKNINRVDAWEKISGEAKYLDDIDFKETYYAKTLRSEKAKANIIKIDIPEIPENYYIVDKNDIPFNGVKMINSKQPFFAKNTVNYIGEPILLVVGPDKQKVCDILNNIKVTYEELEAVFSIDEWEEGKKKSIYGDDNTFVSFQYEKGNLDEIKNKAKFAFQGDYETGYQEHMYLETQSIAAQYKDGKITVWASVQCPYYIKDALVDAFKLNYDKVQIIQTTTGGGFGGKEEFPSILCGQVAAAAVKTGKKVKMVYDRDEDILCSTKRHPSKVSIKSYVDENFNIIGMESKIRLDGGAYEGISSVVLQRAIFAAIGVYNVPNIKVKGAVIATNNVVAGAFRGFGGPQAIFAVESHIEQIANKLKITPLELKMKNHIKQGDLSSTEGIFRDYIPLKEMIEKADSMSNYTEKYKKYSNSNGLKGIGMSLFFHGGGFTGNGERDIIKAKVKLKKHKNQQVEILISNVEMGQGLKTTMSKIAAAALDIPISRIICKDPDTDLVPNSGPTVASRSILIVGELVRKAAVQIKNRWDEAEEFIVEENYKHPEGYFFDANTLKGDVYNTYSFGVNVVEVEVNPVTYEVDTKGVWTVFDVGNAIDKRIVEGQIEGGVVQGLGYGSLEVMVAKEGNLLQKTITNYVIPTAMDFPKINVAFINSPYKNGPYGAKSVGELTLIGSGTAFALAVQNAIKRPISKLPVTPEHIMEVINNYGCNQF